jgi:hypothetical protein
MELEMNLLLRHYLAVRRGRPISRNFGVQSRVRSPFLPLDTLRSSLSEQDPKNLFSDELCVRVCFLKITKTDHDGLSGVPHRRGTVMSAAREETKSKTTTVIGPTSLPRASVTVWSPSFLNMRLQPTLGEMILPILH